MSDISGESRTADCVMERARLANLFERTEVWHIARSKGRTQDFVPIRCSPDEGIALPGPIQRRVPTCPECVVIFGGSGT